MTARESPALAYGIHQLRHTQLLTGLLTQRSLRSCVMRVATAVHPDGSRA
jgi:hypothetical protein